MSKQLVSCWICHQCDVLGADPDDNTEPRCWNCGGPVLVSARVFRLGDLRTMPGLQWRWASVHTPPWTPIRRATA